jgi:hypothetical protein
MLNTRSRAIFEESQKLAVLLLGYRAAPSWLGSESKLDIEYELTCWVEGLTVGCIEGFHSVLQSLRTGSGYGVVFARSWKESSFASSPVEPNVSSLLMAALRLKSDSKLVLLCRQVASRCLLHHQNPLPLAAVIVSDEVAGDDLSSLEAYARCLTNFENSDAEHRASCLPQMIRAFISQSASPLNFALSQLAGGQSRKHRSFSCFERVDVHTAFRQLAHIILCDATPSSIASNSIRKFRMLLPLCLKVSELLFCLLCCLRSASRQLLLWPSAVKEHCPFSDIPLPGRR